MRAARRRPLFADLGRPCLACGQAAFPNGPIKINMSMGVPLHFGQCHMLAAISAPVERASQ